MKASIALTLGAALLAGLGTARAHEHIFVEARAGVLQFATPYTDGGIYHMMPRPVGQGYGGYYTLDEQVRDLNPLDYFTFAVLSDGQTEDDGPNHPVTGADIWLEITSVVGPSGAHFGFWEGSWPLDQNGDEPLGWSYNSTTPTLSFTTNQTPGSANKIQLSEPLAGYTPAQQDPWGHIHNRGFTVDQAGNYEVTFRIIDRTTAHTPYPPSRDYVFHFAAGPSFQPTPKYTAGTGLVLTWPSLMGINTGGGTPQTGVVFSIQRSTTLAPGSWQTIGTVTGTTSATATFTDATATGAPKAFYRLQYPWRSQ